MKNLHFRKPIQFVSLDKSPENENISLDVSLNRFCLLNKTKAFDDKIDWDFSTYGKLWTYNLNYFEYLDHVDKQEGLYLIHDFIGDESILNTGYDPYPISLRGINWIKFLSRHRINNEAINSFLYRDYKWLCCNMEYHIMGNHLLENAFSLIVGGVFFKEDGFYQKGKRLLSEQLKEQVLSDGGHFELSPMYHTILLHRLLDVYSILSSKNDQKDEEFVTFLGTKASRMLSWLKAISFENGDLPMLNDSTYGNSPLSKELFKYATHLSVEPGQVPALGSSGYRKWKHKGMELIFDVADIGPGYQPGHAHADTFTFCLHVDAVPIIVDTGVSTYEKSARRDFERSTQAHNTIEVNECNSSQVWSSFRVGKRAQVIIEEESDHMMHAYHDGFRQFGVTHWRKFSKNKKGFSISDKLINRGKTVIHPKGFLHFHPEVQLQLMFKQVIINSKLRIELINCSHIAVEEYKYALGFNKFTTAQRITYLPVMSNPQVQIELLP